MIRRVRVGTPILKTSAIALLGTALLSGAPAPADTQGLNECMTCDRYTMNQQVFYECIVAQQGSSTCSATTSSCDESGPCNIVKSEQGLMQYQLGD